MRVPEEFRRLCGSFYPRSDEGYATEDEWIAGTLRMLKKEEQKVVKRYLDELLSGRYSDAYLAEAWSSTDPTYNFRPGGHRLFLTKILQELG